ncbi:MAG: methyltransferase domain-containing protein [Methylocystis sp.]
MPQPIEHGPSPWWAGFLLTSPLRRLVHDPRGILSPFVKEGMRVLEPGPGRGFFTLELARLVGPNGKVFASELQTAMLEGLKRRAKRAKLGDRIDARQATRSSLGIDDLVGTIDFALSFAVAHETGEPKHFFDEVARALAPEALLLLVEPEGHVAIGYFQVLTAAAVSSGLTFVTPAPKIDGSHVALLRNSRRAHTSEAAPPAAPPTP